jgi:hypothetical protein
VLTALLGAGGLLLLAAGAAKVADPTRTVGALRALGWPSSPGLVRVGAGVEAVVGAAALVVGGPVVAVLVAGSYVGFAAFVAAALRAGTPVGSCGCFGRADTPPRPRHVAVDLGLAAGAGLAAAAGGAGGAGGGGEALVGAGLGAVVVAVVVAGAAYVALR